MDPNALLFRQFCFHYLDDFFLVGPPLSDGCMQALSDMLLLCQAVQAPVKPEKVLGPSTTLPILGILLDTIAGEPADKLSDLQQELHTFNTLAITHHTCTKRQLLSLIGKLAARSFLLGEYFFASSKVGFGAYWNGAWFSHNWPEHMQSKSIDWKELYAIVMACEVWGAK